MALPILTPRAGPLVLPTDIMARIAKARQQMAQAKFAEPLLQSQIAQNIAKAQQLQQGGLAKLTPAQQAIDAYLTSFKQDPNSANTKLLGLAVRKSVAGSAGTSITTPDGTQVTFGGSSGTIPKFGGSAIGTTAAGGQQPLTPDQQAIQSIFPETPPSPVQQLPGTSGSRKIAGSTTVDMRTGAVTSRPTRTVATLNQNSIESGRKLRGLLGRAVEGFAPFAGITGKGQGFWESLKVGTGKGSLAEQSRIEKLEAAKDNAKIGAVDLMKTLGAPNAVQIANQFEKILPARWNETPETYRRRVKHDLMTTLHEFTSEAQAAQLEGILFGKIEPKTGKIIPVAAIRAPTRQLKAATQSTEDLIKQFRGQ